MSLLHLKVRLESTAWKLNGLLIPNEIEVPLGEFVAENRVNVVKVIAKLPLVTIYKSASQVTPTLEVNVEPVMVTNWRPEFR